MSAASKSIAYRGGIVAFKIPSAWREEYEPHGGATFYEDRPDSGTLRLNVLTFEKKNGLEAMDQSADFPIVLLSGHRMRHYRKDTEEDGTPLHIYRWEVLVAVTPSRCRIVCFSHTVLVSARDSTATQQELQLVDELVRDADYSTADGVVPKAWWRIWK